MSQKGNRYTIESAIEQIHKIHPSLSLSTKQYRGAFAKIDALCSVCEHRWKPNWDSLRQGKGCPNCKGVVKHKHGWIKQWYAQSNIQLLSRYQSARTKNKLRCKRCQHEWQAVWNNFITHNHGCPVCNNEYRGNYNRLSFPSISSYLKNHHPTVKLEPDQIYKNQTTRFWCRCLVCQHRWTTTWDIKVFICRKCHPRPNFGATEDDVRIIIERLTRWKFPKARPAWLKGRSTHSMELDGYNKRHAIAFEYQGVFHYKPMYGEEDLRRTKLRDKRKRMLCSRHGIALICIPYWTSDIRAFIKSKLA